MGLKYNDNAKSITTGAITAGATSIPVEDPSSFPQILTGEGHWFFVTIGGEVVKVTHLSGNDLVCEAIQNAHNLGVTVVLKTCSKLLDGLGTGLERVEESGNSGLRIIGEDPAFHNTIGQDAIDLTVQSDGTGGAWATRSLAAGEKALASGVDSVAIGEGTLANIANLVALGKFNEAVASTILALGVGTADGDRKNAFLAYLDGTLTAPEATIANIGAKGAKAITTKEYVDSGLSAHTTNVSDPHNVTKAQVDLGNVLNSGGSDSTTSTSTTVYANSKAVYDAVRIGGDFHTHSYLPLYGGILTGNLGITQDSSNISFTMTQTLNGEFFKVDWEDGGGYARMWGRNSFIKMDVGLIPYGGNQTESIGNSGASFLAMRAAAFNIDSDERLKDLEDIGDVSWVYDLEPVAYKYKDFVGKSDRRNRLRFGFSAQQVFSKLPHSRGDMLLVDTPAHGEDQDRNWGMAYTELIAPMLKAIQDQKVVIDALEARITALEV